MFRRTGSEREAGLTRDRVLIAADDLELRRQLVSLVQPFGYDVITARTAGESLASTETAPPDAAILDHALPDVSGAELCRQLQGVPQIEPGTPMLVTLPPDADPGSRRDALRSGAWAVLARPIDPDEFRSRFETYMEARRHQRRARTEGLVDPRTGLYNPRGVGRWARGLTALAYRRRAPLACLAIAPMPADDEPGGEHEALSRLVQALRTVSRGADVLGRLGRTVVIVLAPETNAAGAVQYAERLARAFRPPGARTRSPALRVGYDAVENAHDTPKDAIEMVGHASRALRQALSSPWGPWIRPFEPEADSPHAGTRPSTTPSGS